MIRSALLRGFSQAIPTKNILGLGATIQQIDSVNLKYAK
jgi:hypothetical protein